MFKKNNKVKGSILFTVVSVMAILIIFLMGTLVLATSASNRAHRTYSTSQTQYTARTAIDSILKAFAASDDFAEAICDLSPSNSSLAVDVELDQSTLASMGDIHDVVVEYVGQQKYYNEETNAWEDKDQLKITAQVTLGGITKTVTGFIVKDPPLIYSNDGGGAGFVTAGNASTENHTSAFGGTYFNINKDLYTKKFDAETIKTKDYWSNKTFNLTNGQIIEAPFVANGSVYIETLNIFLFPTKGTGISIWGDLTLQNSNCFVLTSENVTSGKTYNYNEIPYLYVDGTFKTEGNNQIGVGNDKLPLNIFCGGIELDGTAQKEIYADMYIMDENKNSILEGDTNGDSKLHKWTVSVINKTRSDKSISHSSGNICSKGSLTLKNFSVDGDVRVDKDLNLEASDSDKIEIGGDVVVGGKLTITGMSIGGKIYCDEVYENGKRIDSAPLKSGIEERTCYATLNTSTSILDGTTTYTWIDVYGKELGNVDVELTPVGDEKDEDNNFKKYEDAEGNQYDAPEYKAYYDTNTGIYITADSAFESTLMTSKGVEILPLASYTDSIYPAEMEKEAILGLTELKDTNGNVLSKGETQIVPTLEDVRSGSVNPYTNAKTDLNKVVSEETMKQIKKNEYTENKATDGEIKITESGTLKGDFDGKTIYIDPSKDNIWIKVEDGVKLTNDSKIVVENETDESKKHNVFLFIDGKLNLASGNSIITTEFKKYIEKNIDFQIITYEGIDEKKGVKVLNPPNIYIYSGKEEKEYSIVAEGLGYITAYIKAPYLDFTVNSLKGPDYSGKVYYNGIKLCGDGETSYKADGQTVERTNLIRFLGCLNVRSYSGKNNFEILYMNNSKSADSSLIFNPSKTNWLLPIYYEEY